MVSLIFYLQVWLGLLLFPAYKTSCKLRGYCNHMNIYYLGTSLLSLTVMADERYLHIVNSKILTSKQVIEVTITGNWSYESFYVVWQPLRVDHS
ncbi:hypothetical protein BKA69DRAFT_1056660 [Paraphysoderma sedebokerense]|nr:hypothetical protein BKA69DRAFT_1056660 [Paraphysoderma sedebokerense]